MNSQEDIKPEEIQNRIYTIRDWQVMLDSDLAVLYGVETKYLNRAINMNIDRFPLEFMFQISNQEWDSIKFQIGTLEIASFPRSGVGTKGKYKFKIIYATI